MGELWQTRVFGKRCGGMQQWYDDFWQAVVGHVQMVERVRQRLAASEDD